MKFLFYFQEDCFSSQDGCRQKPSVSTKEQSPLSGQVPGMPSSLWCPFWPVHTGVCGLTWPPPSSRDQPWVLLAADPPQPESSAPLPAQRQAPGSCGCQPTGCGLPCTSLFPGQQHRRANATVLLRQGGSRGKQNAASHLQCPESKVFFTSNLPPAALGSRCRDRHQLSLIVTPHVLPGKSDSLVSNPL